MLDAPPKESELRSWCYVAFGALVIYCTIPVARTFRKFIDQGIGADFFLYITAIFTLSAGILALNNLRKRALPVSAYFSLLVIVAAFLSYIYQLRDIPEEAIHVAEYAIIGFFVYRALTHRIRDASIYIVATIVVAMIGTIDEYIQWIAPSRYFDLRDIRTNTLAGGLGQLAIFVGLRPKLISTRPAMKSWGRVCYALAGALVLIAIGFLNTPQRIGWYANKFPALSFLLDSKSMMVEYGYRIEDPEIGVFRSRYSADQLQQLNQQRGVEVAGILDRYIRGEGYNPFQKNYSVPRDAYTHEIGVHLFRREFHLDRGLENVDKNKQAEHHTIAYREFQILDKYFPAALHNSRHHWSEKVTLDVKRAADTKTPYESPVSAGVITQYSEPQVLSLFALIIIALLSLAGWLRGREKKQLLPIDQI